MSELSTLIDTLNSETDCATCAWVRSLPEKEQELFARYMENSVTQPKKYTRALLYRFVSEKMGYPLKITAFKECVRRHHVPQ